MKDNCTMNFKKDEYLTLGNESEKDLILNSDSLLNSNQKQKTIHSTNNQNGLNNILKDTTKN